MATNFVDVVLPVKVHQVFTYKIPEHLIESANFGKRVEVPFGAKKFYSGIIIRVHDEEPNYAVKDILSVLDEESLIREKQLEFWQWMSGYYMASLGDIMRTAIPSALQASSSSKIKLKPSFEGVQSIYQIAGQYNRKVLEIAIEITSNCSYDKAIEIDKVIKNASSKRWQSALNLLLERDWIEIEESLDEKYQPRKINYIRLETFYNDEANRKALLDVLASKPKQLGTVLNYLTLAKDLEVVPRKVLLEMDGTSLSSLNTLIKNEVFVQEKLPISRIREVEDEGGEFVELNDAQNSVLKEIENHFSEDRKPVLLHGVTASGKTHVYFELIEQSIQKDKQVLYLLPEIALTTQLEKRIKARFGDKVGVYHSKYSHSERVELWRKMYNGEYSIILSARSGIFLPFNDLGLIVVDEEHDFSYKQFDPSPRYHARDAAVFLAHLHKANILLGSATPSVDTAFNVIQNKYHKVRLETKYKDEEPTNIHIVDLAKSWEKGQPRPLFSDFLRAQISDRLEKKEQVILLQNRRGYVPVVECQDCGHVPMCKNCDITLTYYKYTDETRCHYCGYAEKLPEACNACGSTSLEIKGFGTEKVEEELQLIFPEANIARMDLDSTRRKFAFQELIDDMELGEIDILVGTQMVTKGLDFENVTLVGVLSAENIMGHIDYRSNERAFNMLSQVSGRAGRKGKEGAVVIQTFDLENELLNKVLNQDYKSYLKQELTERNDFKYPPFVRLIRFTIKHTDIRRVEDASQELYQFLNMHFKGRILGPEFPPIPRIRNKYIMQLVVKLDRGKDLLLEKRIILNRLEDFYSSSKNRAITLTVDVDPLN